MTNEELANELERLKVLARVPDDPKDLHRAIAAEDDLFDAATTNLPTIISALRENGRMREALEFYAAPESYQRDIDPDSGCLESQPVIADDGDIARRALKPTPTPDR